MPPPQPQQLTSRRAGPLRGTAAIPGDKSMSHRALMLGALAEGETIISHLLDSADVRATAAALRAMGARIGQAETGLWHIHGRGPHHLHDPEDIIDCGNSGTSARLLAGLVTGCGLTAGFTGDNSLRRRPMKRVLDPLVRMGATVLARGDAHMPFTLRGPEKITPITYDLPIASAQVKSAILLAGLFGDGPVTVREPRATRDHTEIMLRHFGVPVENAGNAITLPTGQMFAGASVQIPGDPSSAAFAAAAGVVNGDADIRLYRVCVNPTRIGFYDALRAMGADVNFAHVTTEGGERVADIAVRGGHPLRGITVAPEQIPAMIDEIPALAVVAACADGPTVLCGLAELRVKESDRLALVAAGLKACGVAVSVNGDDLTIHGTGRPPQGGTLIDTAFDHRIAMSFLVLGSVTAEPVTIDDARSIGTSFPGFAAVMNGLGLAVGENDTILIPDWD
jgi:3-phosphoshikimate 1-carboxyvinyltransferase